jgi:hypothetical protein
MPQQTNLNVPPYFDDFNADNDYYRVLFKPGYPVQARELTSLQSILQNQIEKFGQHFFKEGAKVIPGNISYNALYYALELQNTFSGVPISAYANQLIGSKITGQTSGVTAVVEKVLLANESERENVTLYINYIGSSTQNNATQQFSDGENLVSNTIITSGLLGNQIIPTTSPFATTIANNSSSTGSSFSITEGVYFIRGQFVNVNSETLILDQYTNTPNYRIGLFINEEIVTSDQDSNLQDNSQGFNNYAAPGADRLKISVSLFKKPLDDFDDNNFVELATVVNGVLRSKKTQSLYNNLTDELARRTYAESGDYCVTPFNLTVEDSLNDGVGNRGIFNSNQFTYSGSTPSDNLSLYQISSGKAFVKGFEIETIGPTFLDVPKPRTTKTIENIAVDYNTGPTFKLNRVNGFPTIGFGNNYIISLRNERVGSSTTISPGKEIGLARIYDFRLTSGSYDSLNPNLNQWDISLFDIQTITEITVNEPISLETPTFIKGANSGATGFLKDEVIAGIALTIYDKNGEFIPNESFIIDGIPNNRIATSIVNYTLSDAKSIYGVVGGISTFSADVIQSTEFTVGLSTIAPVSYLRNIETLSTTLSQTVGVGSTTLYVDNTNNISVGSSISVGIAITNAEIVSVGSTFVTISTGSTAGGATLSSLDTGILLLQNVGIGSTIIYLDGAVPAAVVGSAQSTQSRISIGFTGISGSGFNEAPIVSIGDTYVYIGAASTLSFQLTVEVGTDGVSIGSTIIPITPPLSPSVIAIGSSVSVGLGLTEVPVVQVSSSGTSIFIGSGSTVNYSISSGVAVTFKDISPMVVGSAITFTNVSQTVDGDIVSFSEQQFTSKVIAPNALFPGTIVKENNLVSYTTPNLTDPFIGKVVSVGPSSVEIVGVTTLTGICDGKLPTVLTEVSDFKILTSKLDSSSDNTLYTVLPNTNISNVDLTNAVLTIRKSYTVNIQGGELSSPVQAGSNETFLPYSNFRYSLVRSDGTFEPLSSNKFAFISGGSQLQIYGLGSNDTGSTLVATLRKVKPTAKSKLKNRVNSIVIDKSKYIGSGIGSDTLNDGLEYGNYPYGTRVQDDTISLNTPDIIEILGIYESTDTTNPSAPTIILTSIDGSTGTTGDLVIGEKITGQNSSAIAVVAERVTSTQISIIYKNQTRFLEGERLVFEESGVQAVLTSLDSPSFDISSNFTFINGQKSTHYDYGYLIRKNDSLEPTKKLKIYFSNGYYNSSDIGDITTANSYSSFNYSSEIKNINSYRTTDIIDIRPVVSTPSIIEGSRSPFEFYGREFNQSGNSASNILASDETILTSFSYYLGRVDRVFLSKDGTFQVKYGTPSDKPQKPVDVDNAIEIATITLPPYLYTPSQASVKFLEYKRYRMVDIKQLENRIKSLEYYTALSLLETNTEALFISDSDGLNRFKSGFFVDNFTSFKAQENGIIFKNSIDKANKEIRPTHYTTSIDLTPGPVINLDSTADLSTEPIEGINIRKTGDVVTLDYAEVEWLKQQFATRSESVTPFLISFWKGSVELTPASDTWVDPVNLKAKEIEIAGNYAEVLANATLTLNVDPNTGLAPAIWGVWDETWTGTEESQPYVKPKVDVSGGQWIGGSGSRAIYGTQVTTTFEETWKDTNEVGTAERQGTQQSVVEVFDKTSLGNRVVNTAIIPYMRSRNVQFIAKKVKPSTQMYAFFDGKDVTKYCIPKLLEITMISGTFQVGETVIGTSTPTGLIPPAILPNLPSIKFRVAQANHREGTYDSPSNVYPENPYVSGQILPATYSSTSTILNVDTFSLAYEVQGDYGGWIESGMTLVGDTSKASATITQVRLISDISATLSGCLYVPDPNNPDHPRFETGTKMFTLVNNSSNNQNTATTVAEQSFISSGTIETVQESIISVRNAIIENKPVFDTKNISRLLSSDLVSSVQVGTPLSEQVIIGYNDPLAQSFLIEDSTGIFLTRCDIFFKSKDDNDTPVSFQLRTMENGFPTTKVLPFSEVFLNPDQIQISSDGSVATSFVFKSPVYLEGGKEYCMCLASNSTKYSVYISRVGETDLISQTFISNQPYLGSLFKSQNASTWEASQWEDLKFTLYRADFIDSGSVEFYNPQLTENNKQVALLMPNSLNMSSRRIRVSLSSTISDPGLVQGNTVSIEGALGTGNYVGNAGQISGELNIINAGIGFTPNVGVATYLGVPLINVTGNGSGATADITVNDGIVSIATILNGGKGYQTGDILEVGEIVSMPTAANSRLSVSSVQSINQIILDNVQGDFPVGPSYIIKYTNNLGNTVNLNASLGNVYPTAIDTETDGLHIKVNHKNHGMYFSDNLVELSGILPDLKPTKLSAPYASDSNSEISVEDSSQFAIFEGVSVDTNNVGYLLIGDEIIAYTSTSTGLIGGNIIREVNSTLAKNYPVGTPVYKYELNQISLTRINKVHDLANVTISNPITFDSYHIKLDTSIDGGLIDRSVESVGFPTLYINQTKNTGGYSVKASQNIPFELIRPSIQNVTVSGTSISASIRTITGTSIDGNEIPYIDNGFETISINSTNYLDSPRIICSRVNEVEKLGDLPGSRSFNMRVILSSSDTRLSPIIDTQRVSAILISNRINNPVENYATDNRVNGLESDPHAFQYSSKEISLQTSASSIKIILNAHINKFSDIRAFYSIGENPNFTPIFTPFPGYNNLNIKGEIISPENSDGLPDTFVTPANILGFDSSELEYKEYSFSVDNLSYFRSYRIKLVLSSTNQVYVPRIRDLRVIALA